MTIYFINQDDGSIASRIMARPDEISLYEGDPSYVHSDPPECAQGSSPRWDGSSWSCAIDHRGTDWHGPGTSQYRIITRLGDVPPAGWVRGKPTIQPTVSYAEARAAAYPAISEQLDMLWHAMDSGGAPISEPFYSRIKAVKDAYPRDGSVAPGSVIIYGD